MTTKSIYMCMAIERPQVFRISNLTVKEDYLDTEIVLPSGATATLRFVDQNLYKHLYISGYNFCFDVETEDITPKGSIKQTFAQAIGLTQSSGDGDDEGSI